MKIIFKGLEDFGSRYVVRFLGIKVFERKLRVTFRRPDETEDEYRARRHKEIMDCQKTTGYKK